MYTFIKYRRTGAIFLLEIIKEAKTGTLEMYCSPLALVPPPTGLWLVRKQHSKESKIEHSYVSAENNTTLC